MLIFVATLLAAGTLAVIAMLAFSSHRSVAVHPAGTAPSVTITPSLAGHVYLGRPSLSGYCESIARHASAHPPATKHASWTCTGTGHAKPVSFTPATVCQAQFGTKTIATYDSLDDPRTWRCYR